MKVDVYRADGSIEVVEIEGNPAVTPVLYSESKSTTYVLRQLLNGVSIETDDQRIRASGLYEDWEPGDHKTGEIYNAGDQTWECFADYDNAVYPDVKPSDPSWFTFNRPLHGQSPETARPWVKPQHGTTDIYHAGEYMIWTDGTIRKSLRDTNYSPDEYAQAWEVQDG